MQLRSLTDPFLLRTYRCRQAIASPTDALPLDILRIISGFLSLAYFLRTLVESPDFSAPDGLIDHRLLMEMFWFTRMGLFHSWMSAEVFQAIFALACLCSVCLIVGFQVRLCAAILYLIAVSAYRWNFLVIYVDDAIIHLLLFWMIVLPAGRTLILADWLKNGRGVWDGWKSMTVSGTAVRCFLWNLALIYLVAGLWKFTSPMWRDGVALYAVFKLPISYAPDFWTPAHLPLLMIFNYATLILEPLIPLMLFLPKGHYAKYALLAGFIGLHLGSVATLDIPFANLACAGAAVLIFREELMDWFRGSGDKRAAAPSPEIPARIGLSGGFAIFMVAMLTLAMLSSVSLPQWRTPLRESFDAPKIQSATNLPAERQALASALPAKQQEAGYEGLGPMQKTFFGVLWIMGIAQQYQLFNWIDDRNFTVRYKIEEDLNDGSVRPIEPDAMFPPSLRGVLLQFYVHGITWLRIPPERREDLRRSLLTRIARRYCRDNQPTGKIAVYSSVERIDPRFDTATGEPEALLMSFGCRRAEPFADELMIAP